MSNMLKRKVCLAFNQQKFLFFRLQDVLSLLSRTEYSFQRPKTNKYVVWWLWYRWLRKKSESWFWKRKSSSICEKISPPIVMKQTRTLSKKGKHHSVHGIIMSTPTSWYSWPKILFHCHFIHFQSRVKQLGFLGLQRQYWVVCWLCTRFSYSDCKRCRPRNYDKFPRYSSCSLELVVVSKTRLFE